MQIQIDYYTSLMKLTAFVNFHDAKGPNDISFAFLNIYMTSKIPLNKWNLLYPWTVAIDRFILFKGIGGVQGQNWDFDRL